MLSGAYTREVKNGRMKTALAQALGVLRVLPPDCASVSAASRFTIYPGRVDLMQPTSAW
jgi:hypothetical protein